jgi:hypothetical protein
VAWGIDLSAARQFAGISLHESGRQSGDLEETKTENSVRSKTSALWKMGLANDLITFRQDVAAAA